MLDIRPAGSICRFKRNKMNIKPSAALKKCLFGEPDHDSLKADLNTMMTEIQTNDRLRWDFNFTKGEPVEGGRFKWDKLPLPAKTHVLEDQPKLNIIGLKRGDDVTEIASTESSPAASPTISTCPQTTTVLCKGSPSTQRKLPDFFPQKKRSTPSTEESRAKRMRRRTDDEDRPVVSRSIFTSIAKSDDEDSQS